MSENSKWGKQWRITGIKMAVLALTIIMLLTVLSPALRTRSQVALKLKDAACLQAIRNALQFYSQSEGGIAASSLNDILATGEITVKDLQTPFDRSTSDDKCDYYFVSFSEGHGCPGGLLPPDWIQAYGDPADNENRGANILYLDGHVAFHGQPRFDKEIEKFKQDYETKCGSPPLIHPPQ